MILHAGYFVGEFGWLLMRWQAIVRYLSYNYSQVIIGCEPEYNFLFEDFTSDFVPFIEDVQTRNMWLANSTVHKLPFENCYYPTREICLNDKINQKFIKYGEKAGNEYDIIIHARKTKNMCTEYRNWPVNNWEVLVEELKPLRIASIGQFQGAHHIKGTDDLRGLKLKELANVMASSKMFLGPSSGPAHFASLCGLTHLVWSGRDVGVMSNKDRYLKEWNPFETECIFLETWKPSPEQIRNEVINCLYQ